MAQDLKWSEVSRRRAGDQVFAQLKARILNGSLPAESLLPTEAELAASFDTSRTAVREAVRQLEVLGLAESRQGARRTVCSADRLQTFAVMGDVLMPGGELDPAALAAYLDFRCDAMAAMFRRAIEAATPEDWRRLHEAALVRGAETDPKAALDADWQFLSRLADATHNPIYRMMVGTFVSVATPMNPLLAKLSPVETLPPESLSERLVCHAERGELDAIDAIIFEELPAIDRLMLALFRRSGAAAAQVGL